VLAAALTTTSCEGGGQRPQPSTESASPSMTNFDGPLDSLPAGAGGVYTVPRGRIVRDPGLGTPLDYRGNKTITLEGASFSRFDQWPSPELVAAWVDGQPLDGYVIEPGSAAPELVLSVRSSDQIAINRLLQITYSVEGDETQYAALYDLHWVVCDKATVRQQECARVYEEALYG
jgi:hypothetical protein